MEIAERDPSIKIFAKMETPHVTNVAAVIIPARKWLRMGLGGNWKNGMWALARDPEHNTVLFRP